MDAPRPKTRVLDFRLIEERLVPISRRPRRFPNGDRMSMTKKQLRARARRSVKGTESEDFYLLYKPVSEWDMEELARGRVRNMSGNFAGPSPKWISREVHEEAMTRFHQLMRDGVNNLTPGALRVIKQLMTNTKLDGKGRPMVPANVKLDAAKFLIEQTMGKPKQRVEQDISVKLQGVLASAIIVPGTLPAAPDAKALTSPRDAAIDAGSSEFWDAEWSEEDD